MATIIVRTNPDKGTGVFTGQFICSQCSKAHPDFASGKACAESDYKIRTGRKPEPQEV